MSRRAAKTADPLIALAHRIERETGHPVPTPNPDGPTTRAQVLFVLRDPGETESSGANATMVLDPFENTDPTSARQRSALARAGIDRGVCVWWNASPYHLAYKGPLRPGDVSRGARYLLEFVALCPQLKSVVAMGGGAHEVAAHAWHGRTGDLPTLIRVPHPLIYGRRSAERIKQLDEGLRKVARPLRGSG